MRLICAAAILAIDNRIRTLSLELKCLGTSFGGQNKIFQSLGIQHGRRMIKAHCRALPNTSGTGAGKEKDDGNDEGCSYNPKPGSLTITHKQYLR